MREWIILLGILAACIAGAVYLDSKAEAKCTAKGGEWHPQYKSHGLCLPKGTVIDIDD